MRTILLVIVLLISSLAVGQTWQVICDGTGTGTYGCAPTGGGTNYPNPVGFIWKADYRTSDHSVYFYTQWGGGASTSIYSNGMGKYTPNASFGTVGTLTNITDTGTRGDNASFCGASVIPHNGHNLGTFIWDNDHSTAFVGGMLCVGSLYNMAVYNGSSWSDTGSAFSLGAGSYGWSLAFYYAASSTNDLIVQCCSNANSDTGQPVVNHMNPTTYTITTITPKGANGSNCSSGGTNCPPNVLTGQTMVFRPTDRKIYIWGGCNCTTPGVGMASPNTDLYTYDPSTQKFDKPAVTVVSGPLPPLSWPVMAYNSLNDSIWMYSATNEVWTLTFSDMTWRKTTTTGGPTINADYGYGNWAVFDPNTNRVIMTPGKPGNSSWYLWEASFGAAPSNSGGSVVGGKGNLSGKTVMQ